MEYNEEDFRSICTRVYYIYDIISYNFFAFKQTLEILGHTVSNPDDPFILACTHSEPPVLNFAQALHESKTVRQEIEKSVMLQSFVASKEAVTKIRNYFGEEVAMYFVWMDFFGKMLLFPALFGIAYYILRPDNVSVEEDPFMPVFSAFMALWSILYLVVSLCTIYHRRQTVVSILTCMAKGLEIFHCCMLSLYYYPGMKC